MTYDYKEATSNLVLTLFLYILGLVTGRLVMYHDLRGSLQHPRPHPGGRGREAVTPVSRGCHPSRV